MTSAEGDGDSVETEVTASVGIRVRNLAQGYGRHEVIADLSFAVPSGAIVGLLGPNGAGKTTLIRTVATLMPPRDGSLELAGRDVTTRAGIKAARAHLGYLPQGFTADGSLSVRDFVGYNLWMRGLATDRMDECIGEALALVEMDQDARRRISSLSGGMRQRAGIAAAVAGEPEVILLDEPTAGLDPAQRSTFRRMLRSLKGSTVLLSTHLVEDVVSLADQLLVMESGKLVYDGSTSALTSAGESVDALEERYIHLLGKQSE